MANLIILEGARGTFKSSTARLLREQIPESTLINFTGFHANGQEGLAKVNLYYHNWFNFFSSLKGQDITFICDRIFFSELVYSTLYKDYDFSPFFASLLSQFMNVVDKLSIFYLTCHSDDILKERLMRDKVPFGEAEESAIQSMRQQLVYDDLFSWMEGKAYFWKLDTTYRVPKTLAEEIKDITKAHWTTSY